MTTFIPTNLNVVLSLYCDDDCIMSSVGCNGTGFYCLHHILSLTDCCQWGSLSARVERPSDSPVKLGSKLFIFSLEAYYSQCHFALRTEAQFCPLKDISMEVNIENIYQLHNIYPTPMALNRPLLHIHFLLYYTAALTRAITWLIDNPSLADYSAFKVE